MKKGQKKIKKHESGIEHPTSWMGDRQPCSLETRSGVRSHCHAFFLSFPFFNSFCLFYFICFALFYLQLAGSPCFATVNLYLLRKVNALSFSLLLHYYVNSGKLLNYVYIDICPRRRLHRMPAFKKRQKLPVV